MIKKTYRLKEKLAFVEQVKEYMKETGCTQSDLELVLGKKSGYISHWITQRSLPGSVNVTKLLEFFALSREEQLKQLEAVRPLKKETKPKLSKIKYEQLNARIDELEKAFNEFKAQFPGLAKKPVETVKDFLSWR